jgi:hypothetical protein
MDVNWLLVAIGCGIIAGASAMFRHRERIYRLIIEGQRATFGERAARLQDGGTPMSGVGVPAVFGVVIGVGFILGGVFGVD